MFLTIKKQEIINRKKTIGDFYVFIKKMLKKHDSFYYILTIEFETSIARFKGALFVTGPDK